MDIHPGVYICKYTSLRTSPVVQRLTLLAFTAGDAGSSPGPETKILHAVPCTQKKKKKSVFLSMYAKLQLKVFKMRIIIGSSSRGCCENLTML